MIRNSFAVVIASIFTIGLSACDVDKTQEGSVTVPKYEVSKTQEGNVTLPQYDVKTPDVAIKKEERTVTVPTVKTEERTVEVPKLEVRPASEGN